MFFMLIASLVSCCNVPIVEEEEEEGEKEEKEEKEEEEEEEKKESDQISAVRVSDIDIETKM